MFGLTNSEGNHGEDVKEYYFYIDSTPTHSYMKYLYKYPQREFPYRDLVETNRRRSREEFEYELLDTGIFDDDRYFDVFVEYAKKVRKTCWYGSPSIIGGRRRLGFVCCQRCGFAIHGRGMKTNTKPSLRKVGPGAHRGLPPRTGRVLADCDGAPELLFTENESNASRLWGQPNPSPYVKDAFHDYVIAGKQRGSESRQDGDQGRGPLPARSAWRRQPNGRLRLSSSGAEPFDGFEQMFATRIAEADEFYQRIAPDH